MCSVESTKTCSCMRVWPRLSSSTGPRTVSTLAMDPLNRSLSIGHWVVRSEGSEPPLDRLGDRQAAKIGVLTAHDLHADRQALGHPGGYHRGRGAEQVRRKDRAHQLQGRDRVLLAGDVEA